MGHLHIVAQDAAGTRMGETWAVVMVNNDLKRLAKDMGVPVIMLVQLARGDSWLRVRSLGDQY